jgi:hypothetical protein
MVTLLIPCQILFEKFKYTYKFLELQSIFEDFITVYLPSV